MCRNRDGARDEAVVQMRRMRARMPEGVGVQDGANMLSLVNPRCLSIIWFLQHCLTHIGAKGESTIWMTQNEGSNRSTVLLIVKCPGPCAKQYSNKSNLRRHQIRNKCGLTIAHSADA